MEPIYKRVLIKISGEALAGDKHFGLNNDILDNISKNIKILYDAGIDIGLVVGGGNFWRGAQSSSMDRARADHMGMLATVMNALALSDALERNGVEVRVQTAIEMRQIAEPYIKNKAMHHMEKNRVIIFGCGTGNPFFTTDTAAALRAIEIGADVLLLAKNVDAVYDSDPAKNPDAKKFSELTHQFVLERNLKVMDSTAASLCRDHSLKVHVFGISDPYNVVRAVMGESIGTVIV